LALDDALDRYFSAWNDHDPAAVVGAFVKGGTYQDPTTPGPLSGEALAATVAGVFAAFPDVIYDLVRVAPISDAAATAQWVMRGTNRGPLPTGPPTGATIALPGADFIDYDPVADRLTKVVGYFDTATMFRQLGLQMHISPPDMDPVTRYGIGVRVDTQRRTVPGAFTVTWIDVDSEHQLALFNGVTEVVTELLGDEGYLGSCFASVGRRNYTFTAWTSVDAAKSALRGGAHGEAMRLAHAGGLGDSAIGITSIWTPEVLNGVFHAGPGRSHDLAELTGQWR
jgi:steroid delta-isomerase-like uncharacterized protein